MTMQQSHTQSPGERVTTSAAGHSPDPGLGQAPEANVSPMQAPLDHRALGAALNHMCMNGPARVARMHRSRRALVEEAT